jgi:hypothetical protein
MGGVPPESFHGNAVPLEEGEADTAAQAVGKACAAAVPVLEARIAAGLKQVQPVAQTLAVGRMKLAREEIVAERERYLDLADLRRAGRNVHLLFKEQAVRDLLTAWRDVHRARRRLEDARVSYDKHAQQVAASIPQGFPFPDGPTSLADLTRGAHPNVAAKRDAAMEALAMAVIAYGRQFPILFRIWNGTELPTEAQYLELGPRARFAWDKLVFNQIWWTLEEAQKANSEVVAQLESDPEAVWKYPPAVSAALDQLGFGDRSIEARAAQERVSAALGRTPAWAKLCLVANAVEGVAFVAAAAPPVLLALACFSVVMGAAATLEEFVAESRKEAAFKAVLDPGKALCGEPDYSGVIVGVVFTMLGLAGVRAARLATAAQEVNYVQGVFTAVAVEQAVVAVAEP